MEPEMTDAFADLAQSVATGDLKVLKAQTLDPAERDQPMNPVELESLIAWHREAAAQEALDAYIGDGVVEGFDGTVPPKPSVAPDIDQAPSDPDVDEGGDDDAWAEAEASEDLWAAAASVPKPRLQPTPKWAAAPPALQQTPKVGDGPIGR